MRFPLAVNLRSRDGTLTKDARVQNALIEKVGEDQNGPLLDILSRPGMSDTGRIGYGTPQLLYPWNGLLHVIYGDALRLSSLVTVAAGTAVLGLNPSDKAATVDLSNNNLTANALSGGYQSVRGNVGKSAGKWYWEVVATGTDWMAGVGNSSATLTNYVGSDANGWSVAAASGAKFTNAVSGAYTTAIGAGTVIGFALDMDGGTLTLYRGGASLGVMYSGLTGTLYPMLTSSSGNSTLTVNFGDSAFSMSIPGGFSKISPSTALAPTNSGLQFDAQETNDNAANPRLMVKNKSQAWHVSNTGVVTAITLPGTMGSFTGAVIAITRSGSTATATYFTYGSRPIRVGDSVIVAGATNSAYNGTFTVTVANTSSLPYSFSYTVAGTPATPDGATYPSCTVSGGTVRGIPYINGYFCIMDVNGVIWHSNADDPSTWSSTAFITSRNENGAGVALGKSLNYLIAFKEWSTEFYYDAHNTVGSAFSPVENGFVRIGCASGDSLALVAAQLVWVGQSKARGYGVYAMQGLNVRKISSEDIDRVLASANLATVYSFALNCRGHELYFLTIPSLNVTLVYDFTSDAWTTWTSLTLGSPVAVSSITRSGTTATVTTPSAHGLSDGDPAVVSGANQGDYNGICQIQYVSPTVFTYEVANSPTTPATGTIFVYPYTETYFQMIRAAVYQGVTVFAHASDGQLYQMSTSLYQDAGIPINVFSRTERLDGGSDALKTMGRVRVICDSQSSGTAMVRWSDDDAQTFAAYRIVNLASDPCQTQKCGAFRRRTLAFRHVANATLRAHALEVN